MIDPHDMVCQELVEMLTEYLDGTLGADDLARLQAHLAVCDHCAVYVEQFQTTIALAGASGGTELTPELRNLLARTFRSPEARV